MSRRLSSRHPPSKSLYPIGVPAVRFLPRLREEPDQTEPRPVANPRVGVHSDAGARQSRLIDSEIGGRFLRQIPPVSILPLNLEPGAVPVGASQYLFGGAPLGVEHQVLIVELLGWLSAEARDGPDREIGGENRSDSRQGYSDFHRSPQVRAQSFGGGDRQVAHQTRDAAPGVPFQTHALEPQPFEGRALSFGVFNPPVEPRIVENPHFLGAPRHELLQHPAQFVAALLPDGLSLAGQGFSSRARHRREFPVLFSRQGRAGDANLLGKFAGGFVRLLVELLAGSLEESVGVLAELDVPCLGLSLRRLDAERSLFGGRIQRGEGRFHSFLPDREVLLKLLRRLLDRLQKLPRLLLRRACMLLGGARQPAARLLAELLDGRARRFDGRAGALSKLLSRLLRQRRSLRPEIVAELTANLLACRLHVLFNLPRRLFEQFMRGTAKALGRLLHICPGEARRRIAAFGRQAHRLILGSLFKAFEHHLKLGEPLLALRGARLEAGFQLLPDPFDARHAVGSGRLNRGECCNLTCFHAACLFLRSDLKATARLLRRSLSLTRDCFDAGFAQSREATLSVPYRHLRIFLSGANLLLQRLDDCVA